MAPKRNPLAGLDVNIFPTVSEQQPKFDNLTKQLQLDDDFAQLLKRRADEANLDEINSDEGDESSSDEEIFITDNCDQIRRKINRFIDNGGMKVTEFIAALHVNSPAYYRFMKQRGKDKGAGSNVYIKAMAFFQKRERKGIPMPKKRKVAAPDAPGAAGKGQSNLPTAGKTGDDVVTEASKAAKASKTAPTSTAAATFADITLEGEEDDAVPVYDSCDVIRRKINAHLRKPGVTQAQFLRDLHAQTHGPRRPKSLQSSQLAKFRSYKGALAGNTSGIFYAAYVYFEKERIAAKRSKSEHRLDMEDAWCTTNGVDVTTNPSNVSYITGRGQGVALDDLGKPYCFATSYGSY